MKTSIINLVMANPSGLLELQPVKSIREYRESMGFDLKNIWTIYESRIINHNNEDWFSFPGKSLETLLTVSEESQGDLLVVYIVETIKDNKVYCHLILSDQAYQEILSDNTQLILKVHQMYSKFFQDHIALNMTN